MTMYDATLGIELVLQDDGSFLVSRIVGPRGTIDDEGWLLKPGYRLLVSVELEHDGSAAPKVSYSRKRIRRKFRPASPVIEDGTESNWEES